MTAATSGDLPEGVTVTVTVGPRTIERIVSTYSDIAPGELGALFGSTDHLEFAAHAASAVLSVKLDSDNSQTSKS